MKKNKKTIIIVGIILIITLGFIILFSNLDKLEKDSLKFKKDYESLNNKVRESDGETYNSISIPKDNPIKYINTKEALDILESDKAIIYIGAEWCPWCRNAVPILFEVAKKYQVEAIYYLNLDKEKSNYEIKDGKLKEIQKGTKSYYQLLDKLADHLDDYVLTDDNGKKYDTKEKRIFMPFIVAIKDKKVVDKYIGTVTLETDQTKYDNLTKEQHTDLFNTYDAMFAKVYGNKDVCTEGEKCD